MSSSSTSNPTLHELFQEIGTKEYRSVIRFFEDYEESLQRLPLDEYFEILVAYAEALFETASYEKHLQTASYAIELSVIHNIKIHKGYNIFQQLLFKKAASHFYLQEYAQSEHILRELIKICPSEDLYSRFLIKVLRKRTPTHVHTTRAVSVSLFILSAVIICVEILAVRPFFSTFTSTIEFIRNAIFFLGWVVLLGGDGVNYLRMHREVKQFEKKVQAEKLRKLHERHKTLHHN